MDLDDLETIPLLIRHKSLYEVTDALEKQGLVLVDVTSLFTETSTSSRLFTVSFNSRAYGRS